MSTEGPTGSPEGFPPDFPLPAGAVVVGGDADPLIGSIDTAFAAVNVIDLVAFFEAELPRRGWEITQRDEAGLEISGPGFCGRIELEDDGGFVVQLATT